MCPMVSVIAARVLRLSVFLSHLVPFRLFRDYKEERYIYIKKSVVASSFIGI